MEPKTTMERIRPLLRALPVMVVVALVLAAPSVSQAQNVSGAIWTTDINGHTVNKNIYDNRCDVFLNGGPNNCRGSGLPQGCYLFQVTAPPAGDNPERLLSTDSITQRFVEVNGSGHFVEDTDGSCALAASYLPDCSNNPHPPGQLNEVCTATGRVVSPPPGQLDSGHDASTGDCDTNTTNIISVRMFPFINTPNSGGEYKVYLTPLGDYDGSCPSGKTFGFDERKSKTDNFKVVGPDLCADGCSNPGECVALGLCNAETGACVPLQDGTPCGDSGTECRNQDTCVAGICQDNGFKGAGTACGSSAGTVCDNPDTCNGSGVCQANYEPSTTVCRAADSSGCDVTEYCNGNGACPDDAKAANGTLCQADQNLCTIDHCQGGVCVNSGQVAIIWP